MRRNQRPPSADLVLQQCNLVRLRQRLPGNALVFQHGGECAEILFFVFADVQAGQMEAEQPGLKQQRSQRPSGGEVSFVGFQGIRDQLQIGDKR